MFQMNNGVSSSSSPSSKHFLPIWHLAALIQRNKFFQVQIMHKTGRKTITLVKESKTS
ncbi:hypothetical protein T01_5253 [Trichinella spiralis]|uniref:Uncharacterized protein n=1 Tax=Trichinella spiralis TaxID=6334 RepID=A0A0V1B198_TRISP|nr:hypothetical protein T01_5253 [Trichinella spiralis]